MIDKLARAFTKLLAEVKELRADVQNMPTPKNGEPGKPGVSPEPEAIAELVLAQLPEIKDGEPGKDADIEAVIKEVLAQIPTPKDGKPGRDAQPPLLADVAALVLAQIPKPKDGVSPDPKAVAIEAAKLIPKPKDGVSPDPKAVAALVPVPAPKQGKPGKDGKSITDVRLERNILSVWIDGVKKRVGKIDPPAQPAFQGGGAIGRDKAVTGEVQYIEELRAVSDADQNPVGTNNPLTVTFGAAQGTPSDPIQVGADGVITVNETGLYQVRFSAQYGRSGSSGTSWLYFRTLIAFDGVNFVQVGRTVLVKLSNANEDLSTQNLSTITLQQGWKTKVEIMRGSEGNDSGGLIATTPAEGTWTASYSAEATIQRIVWAQT